MTAYYNEIDPVAAQAIRELINEGAIASGEVDERSIEDVTPADLAGFTQCHFFAGIGVWSYALRLAGWPDDKPGWTGSCPCQPFSTAGKRAGFDDERHLWPAWFWLIDQCRPGIVFGEQVGSKGGIAWLDLVHTDLEGSGYSVGAVNTPAAGFGAPHIRQRIWFVAHGVADALRDGQQGQGEVGRSSRTTPETDRKVNRTINVGRCGWLADAYCYGSQQRSKTTPPAGHWNTFDTIGLCPVPPGPTNGFWRDADWLRCRDHKWRPVEPGTSPLVDGIAADMGRVPYPCQSTSEAKTQRLKVYGNAINAIQAAEFISATRKELKC